MCSPKKRLKIIMITLLTTAPSISQDLNFRYHDCLQQGEKCSKKKALRMLTNISSLILILRLLDGREENHFMSTGDSYLSNFHSSSFVEIFVERVTNKKCFSISAVFLGVRLRFHHDRNCIDTAVQFTTR